jgi:hypothetical protein
VSAGRIVLVAVGIALAYPVYQAGSAERGPTDSQSSVQPERNPTSPSPAENDLRRIASALEAANSNPDAKRENERADRDLEAQEGMERWAFWMLLAAVTGTVLTVIGVIFIWRTLVHTRRAAVYSGIAARQAKLANRAAIAAVEVTQDAASAQLRPYVYFVDDPDYKSGALTRDEAIKIWLKNCGATPARDVAVSGGFLICERPIGDREPDLNIGTDVFRVIPPGERRFISIPGSYFTPAEIGQIASDKFVLLMRLRLEYKLLSGSVDFDDFTAVLDSGSLKTGKSELAGKDQRQRA